MTLLAQWFGIATVALSVAALVYWALRARRFRVQVFYYRGQLMTAAGIGIIGLSLVLMAFRAFGFGPRTWLVLSVFGAALWIVGEIWDRQAKKNIETLQRLTAIAEESRMKTDGKDSTTP